MADGVIISTPPAGSRWSKVLVVSYVFLVAVAFLPLFEPPLLLLFVGLGVVLPPLPPVIVAIVLLLCACCAVVAVLPCLPVYERSNFVVA